MLASFRRERIGIGTMAELIRSRRMQKHKRRKGPLQKESALSSVPSPASSVAKEWQKQRSVTLTRGFYSSPESSPALDVGAPPNIDGTPAGGADLPRAFAPPLAGFFAADRPVFAAVGGAAFLAGFADFFAPAFLAGFFAAARFFVAVFFLAAVLPAAFLVVFVFFAAAFFFAAIFVYSCRDLRGAGRRASFPRGDLHDVYGHLR